MVSAHKDGWDGHFAFPGVVLVECAEPQVLSRTGNSVQVGLVADGLVVFLYAYYYIVNEKILKKEGAWCGTSCDFALTWKSPQITSRSTLYPCVCSRVLMDW